MSTCTAVTSEATPCPPSEVTIAPFTNPVPAMVRITVVSASALFGSMSSMVSWGVAVMTGTVEVIVGRSVDVAVSEAGGTSVDVIVGTGVRVADEVGKGVNVKVAEGTGEAGITPGGSVAEGGGAGVGVMNAGLPNSLHPRSGAAPRNPVIGLNGIGSPFVAVYCEIPLSMAGELAWRSKPLKSSSTVSQAPSGPGFGAA